MNEPRTVDRAAMQEEGSAEAASGETPLPELLPLLLSDRDVLFPQAIVPLTVSSPETIRLINDVVGKDRFLAFLWSPSGKMDAKAPSGIGCAAKVIRMMRLPEGSVQVLLQGIRRFRLLQLVRTDPYPVGRLAWIDEDEQRSLEVEALIRNLQSLFQKTVGLSPYLPQEMILVAANLAEQPGGLADLIAASLNLKPEEKQQILETFSLEERLRRVTEYINRELEVLEIGSRIQTRIKERMEKGQREHYLREQLREIQHELGEEDEQAMEVRRLREAMEKAGLSPEAQQEAELQLNRLETMPPQAAEYQMVRTYLDWLIHLPWTRVTEDRLDLDAASRILDEDHYDLEKIKGRILEFLAVRKLKPEAKGSLLCFVGPPGVGKTSLGQSIARALGRQFVRISLGGVRDEAEIRGHRRTYIGALPGRIVQELRRAGSRNPVFMLDEVDKIGMDFRGDPAAALLEVLDPQQNKSFLDHYLGVPFDLSQVIFIATANTIDPIPPALNDRMETLTLPGYTEVEKREIALRYLIPRQIDAHGLTADQLQIDPQSLGRIIRTYTHEAGIRDLERTIATLCRKRAAEVAGGRTYEKRIRPEDLEVWLGPPRFRHELASEKDEIGVATGLAWTQTGGDILFVEALLMPGKGNLILTGHLGQVMQESARAALSYIRAQGEVAGHPIDAGFYQERDIHVHVPAGAIPKDGPSAGVALATAMASALSRRPIRKETAMTGEITLRGKVLPVGGIKEKVLAAHRAGLASVILPKENEKDLSEVPEHVRTSLRFDFVDRIDEVWPLALKEMSDRPKGP